jgi:hypothetical protein
MLRRPKWQRSYAQPTAKKMPANRQAFSVKNLKNSFCYWPVSWYSAKYNAFLKEIHAFFKSAAAWALCPPKMPGALFKSSMACRTERIALVMFGYLASSACIKASSLGAGGLFPIITSKLTLPLPGWANDTLTDAMAIAKIKSNFFMIFCCLFLLMFWLYDLKTHA